MTATQSAKPPVWDKLRFRYPFRKYQNLIFAQVENHKTTDSKYHIVAPPGSGKTIVGLELIRRFGAPAVIFAPTSTIQLQWKEKMGMFLPDDGSVKLDSLVSIKPDTFKPINVYTYQLLSSPAENLEFVDEAALSAWEDQLIGQGIAPDAQQARSRIKLLKKNNPESYTKELARYYKKIKDTYLDDPAFDGTTLLHENARKLIRDLVSHGVRIVVMDEAHHLLDYWALIIKELLKRIENPIVIGLTATPPLSADDEELANYVSIMDQIDFEIPTPAVVKEGNLAPYQDLVYFCNPTGREREFIASLQTRFQSLISDMGSRESFRTWVTSRILERKLEDGTRQDWTSFFNTHVFLAIAGCKYIEQILRQDLPRDIVEVEEINEEIKLDDWIYLLTDYSLNYLKVSGKEEDHAELKNIIAVLRSFGYVLTEQGIRQQRSPSDKILAFSEGKNEALVDILRTEMDGIGRDLRAVVITDFEKQSATQTGELSGILDGESGGAVRAFRYISGDRMTTKLEPVLVTGTTVLIEVDKKDEIIEQMERWRKENGFRFTFKTTPTPYDRILEIEGSGPDWKTNTYVRMVTDLFDRGTIKCLVGTRGLLGEGWDSLTLNTLIDLTQATTSMTVNQIRGRSIRLDPEKPMKVANNWDIVCIDPTFEKGDRDFERFLNKHKHFYGLGSKGKIVKGYMHVDEQLGIEYQTLGFKRIAYKLVNMRMLGKAKDRNKAYRDWGVGDKYSNFEYAATKLDARDLKFQTVYQLKDSLRAIFNNILIGIGTFAFWYYYLLRRPISLAMDSDSFILVAVLSFLFVAGVLVYTGRNIHLYITKAFIEVPLDSFVLDIGKALLKSLRESGLVSSSQSIDNVRVVQDESKFYDVYLDYSSKEDAALFSAAMKELLSPVTNQRYLVSRSIDNVDIGFYSPLWWTIRKLFRFVRQEKTAYHPVPTVLSINKDRAMAFAGNWKTYVGGGELIYTRTAEGAQILLTLRKYNRHMIKRMNYEIWK